MSATHGFGQGQASLSGRVTDSQGAGVAGALISLYARANGLRVSTATDTQGSYRFDALAPDDYVLEAEAGGFARASVQSVRIKRATASTLDVALQLVGVREVVVVTASGTPQPIDEVSKAITVVGRQEIEERNEFALAEALRTAPGLRVQQLGGPGAFTTIKTRGLRNEDTALLIDGIRFRDLAAPQGDASGYLADFLVTGVDRLEVLRGSGSSLYGSNAIGGVINIVTDEGGGRTRGRLLLEGGSLGLFRGRAQMAGGFKNESATYSAGLSHLNVARGIDGDDATRNTNGQGRINFRLTPTAMLSARIYASDSFLQLNTSPQAIGSLPRTGIIDAVPLAPSELRRYESGTPLAQLNPGTATFISSANNPDASRSASFFSGSVNFARRQSETFSYSVTYHALNIDRTFGDGPGGVSFQPAGNTRSDSGGVIQTLNARMNFRLGRSNSIDAGYEFENERYLSRSFPVNPASNASVDVSQRSSTFFVQDQMRLLGDRWQLSAAFRSQFFRLDDPRFAPVATAPYQGFSFKAPASAYTGDGSVAYFFRKTGTKIRGHAGNGYRAPSLYERFGTSFGSFGYSIYGDPRLRPERSVALDTGVDQALFDNRLRASATYFYTRLQETIIFDFSGIIAPGTDPFGRFGGYRNSGGGLARGLEFSAAASPVPSLDLTAAYTFTNADLRTPVVGDILRSFIIPDHQFSFVATQRFGRRFFVNFDLTTSTDYLAPVFDPGTFASRAFRFKGIVKADVGASYRVPLSDFRSVRFFGKVDNLLDRAYFENGFRTPGATALGGMQFEF